jgi:YidC/Oxa1 family membrane protein insertase
MEEKKEMSMETRLLIFFVLMGAILLGTQYFYKAPPQPQPVAKATDAKGSNAPAADQSSQTPASPPNPGAATQTTPQQTPQAQVPPPPPADMPGRVQADKEETSTIETDVYRVTFSNKGAVAKSWILKAYKDHEGKPLDLINTRALDKVPAPFSVLTKVQLGSDPNMALFKTDASDDHLSVSFEFSDGRAVFKKSFHFDPHDYLIGVTSEVGQNGVLVPHQLEWRGGYGDQTVATAATDEHAVYYDTKLQTKDAKEAKDGPVSFSGQMSFEGMEDKFFACVFLPSTKATSEVTVFSDTVPNAANGTEQRAGVAVGGEGANIGSYFIGPKDSDLLSTVDPRLTQLIDWGWTKILAEPLFIVLHWTADHVTRYNYGWAIILVTVAINILLSPLSLQSMKSSRKMQQLQPQIAALNAKYKGIKMNDPRKAEQNQEMMDLYKREGVNPMGGCIPMLIQFPFLIAFYKVLSISIAMRGASWLWIHDLSQPETIAIRLLPVLLIVTQFLTQKMTPAPGMDPSQQKMMMITPVIFGYIFWFLSSGLVLYYLTSNLVAIARQMILNRITGPLPKPAVIDVKPQSKKRRS